MEPSLQSLIVSLTQPRTVVCNNSGPGFFMAFIFVLACSAVAVPDSALAAPYIDPSDCGGDGQPACYVSAAEYLRKVKPEAGAFRDGRNGGEWWSCDGWNRTIFAVDSGKACESKECCFKFRRARHIYSEKDMTYAGAFIDIDRKEWWRCPEGFFRNLNAVDDREACSAEIGKACDPGLIDYRDPNQKEGGGYTCLKKGVCGKEFQRPCKLIERIPACDSGLREVSATNLCLVETDNDDFDRLYTNFEAFFKNTWEGRALDHQRALSFDVPFAEASMFGTHNSYNSRAYRYLDPNQFISIEDQLSSGSYFIELDLWDENFEKKTGDVILCHRKKNNGFCGPDDRKLEDGLEEVRRFLDNPKYSDRVLIIQFDYNTAQDSKVASIVQQKLGSYIYRRDFVYKYKDQCVAVPATLAAREVLDKGKRVIIFMHGYCSSNANLRNMVFQGLEEIEKAHEDLTSFSGLGGVSSNFTPAEVAERHEGGTNLVNFDYLYINDKLKAGVWSWNTNEPNNASGNEDCAAQTSAARLGKAHVWKSIPCSNRFAFACQDATWGAWKVTATSGPWAQGETECKKLAPAGRYFFSVPASAEENLKLTKAKPADRTIWLNYTDQDDEGKWIAKHRWTKRRLQIWSYTGTPCSGGSCLGWQKLDNNVSKTVAITGDGNLLAQLHNDGEIWRYTDTACNGDVCPGWEKLDSNSKTIAITAGGDKLYQLHNNGSIYLYTGPACSGGSCGGWQKLDKNAKTIAITAGDNELYQLHNNGNIFRYTGPACSGGSCGGWLRIGNNPRTIAITAGDDELYQLHNNGNIFLYTDTPCSGGSCGGWQELDNNPKATGITAGDDELYQLHNNGNIFRYTGPACTGGTCGGWQKLDNNPKTTGITAGDDELFQLHNNGNIFRYTGTACSGDTCGGWQRIGNNAQTIGIAAGGKALFAVATGQR